MPPSFVLSHTAAVLVTIDPEHDRSTHFLYLPPPPTTPPTPTPHAFAPPLPQGQLQAFLTLLKEGEKELCDAAFADLHKSSFEAYSTEISLCEGEIHTAMAELKEWMKPVSTGSSALNFPCWSSTQRDPLGVVLVLGAWNYPIQLCLAPLVGAIAGGNCVLLKPGSYAVNTSHCIARLFNKYMDTDCIRVAEGDRKVTSAILDQAFDKIFFTGSGYVKLNIYIIFSVAKYVH
jgi:aldehyde dehydrogenase (NAD+)